jgi:hypothetical protein
MSSGAPAYSNWDGDMWCSVSPSMHAASTRAMRSDWMIEQRSKWRGLSEQQT